jgi:hypothetical protein
MPEIIGTPWFISDPTTLVPSMSKALAFTTTDPKGSSSTRLGSYQVSDQHLHLPWFE